MPRGLRGPSTDQLWSNLSNPNFEVGCYFKGNHSSSVWKLDSRDSRFHSPLDCNPDSSKAAKASRRTLTESDFGTIRVSIATLCSTDTSLGQGLISSWQSSNNIFRSDKCTGAILYDTLEVKLCSMTEPEKCWDRGCKKGYLMTAWNARTTGHMANSSNMFK